MLEFVVALVAAVGVLLAATVGFVFRGLTAFPSGDLVFYLTIFIGLIQALFLVWQHFKSDWEIGLPLAAIFVAWVAVNVISNDLSRHQTQVSPPIQQQPSPEIYDHERLIAKELFDKYVQSTPDLKKFPWPPPKPSAMQPLPRGPELEYRLQTLWDVSQFILMALRRGKYFEHAFYYVPYGFALVTRLEQISADGTPLDEHVRWQAAATAGMHAFTLAEYIKALFLAPAGRYRTIVFVVTSENFAPSSSLLTRKEAAEWFQTGHVTLDGLYRVIRFDRSYTFTALIYEFFGRGQEKEANLEDPSNISGIQHLTKAGLWSSLRCEDSRCNTL